jgi:acyl-[acyl-carrier-protein]-phospholipid O-acyltransferase/long-chain-fatty-acid--[acyl-carrier-protein] ligase
VAKTLNLAAKLMRRAGPARPGSFCPDQVLLAAGGPTLAANVFIAMLLARWTVRLCLWLLAHTFYRVHVCGAENLPRRGPALLVCNHISSIDAFLIGAAVPRPIYFLMSRPFYEARGIRWLAKRMGAIPISAADPPAEREQSLHAAQARLRAGEPVCLFADSALMRIGHLPRFGPSLEGISHAVAAPIVPINLDRVWGNILRYERGRFSLQWPRRIPYRVTVSFGAALAPGASAFEVRHALMTLSAEAFSRRDKVQRPLPEAFLDCARRNWRRFAIADSSGREASFGQALIGALLFRRFILRHCPNERMLGVLLPPSVPAAVLNFAISLAGRVAVNLNYTAPAQAIEAAIERCEIKTIFTSQKLLERFGLAKRPGMAMVEEVAQSFARRHKLLWASVARLVPTAILRRWLIPDDVKLDSLATIVFSSGSTGTPKGVMLSHRNVLSNLEGVQQAMDVDRRDCLLGILPFFHSFGFTVALWLSALSGFGAVYHTTPLEARKIGELCRKHRVTLLVATPSFVWEYVRRCEPGDFASLRAAIVGAERMRPALADAFWEKFHLDLFQGYGCTELAPVVSVETSGCHALEHLCVAPCGTVGRPIPGVAVRVVNPQTFAECGPGEAGMLLVKGPNVMAGYLGEPEKTRQAIWEDGWYITGDVAKLDDDGFITITDRLSRFSKIAGEMVSHVHVEEALHRALGSLETRLVVTSVSDDLKGERFVVLHTELGMSVDDLLKRLRDSGLPPLWVPRREHFYRVESLPIMGSGKLDLKLLKETAQRRSATRAAAA